MSFSNYFFRSMDRKSALLFEALAGTLTGGGMVED
jgi:hypothetical protein